MEQNEAQRENFQGKTWNEQIIRNILPYLRVLQLFIREFGANFFDITFENEANKRKRLLTESYHKVSHTTKSKLDTLKILLKLINPRKTI